MRSRNFSPRDEDRCADFLTPSLSMASSSGNGPPNGSLIHRISPTNSDTDAILGTPLLPSRGSPTSPVRAIRRTLTYSPTKRGKRWSRRITVMLVGLMAASVFFTMLCTLFLMGQTDNDPDRGLAFGTPPQGKRNTTSSERVVGGHPRIRGGPDTAPKNPPAVRIVRGQPRVHFETDRNVLAASLLQDERIHENGAILSENAIALKANHAHDHITSPDAEQQDVVENKDSLHWKYPLVVYLDTIDPPPLLEYRDLEDDPMLHAPPGYEAAPQDLMKPDYSDEDCVPMHDWQTKSFPNCNLLHEYDLKAAGPGIYMNNTDALSEDTLALLGQGWFRHTWRLDVGNSGERVVLKTLRLEREFYDEFYELHRRDAVAMERLTHSPFIMDIYGYCGQSALNELADFGQGNISSLEKLDRQMRNNQNPEIYRLKLQLASSIAVGVAHIHEIDSDDRPSMVHYDLNPRNIAIVGTGKPKINDFNIAEFLRWNPATNETCGFPSRLHEPWWRAPEEVRVDQEEEDRPLLNEKVDVYALGNILHHVLTTHSPRGKMKKERIDEIRSIVARGEPPVLDEKYTTSEDPAIKAFRDAMKLCFEPDPKKRGSSREVAEVLIATLMELRAKKNLKEEKKRKKKR